MMPMSTRRRAVLFGVLFAVVLCTAPTTRAQSKDVVRTVLLRHDAPQPGYEAVLVRVEIPVGGREGRHTHPGLAMIHVLQGAMTLDYEGKPSADYKPGDSFSIEPGKIHEGINKGTAPTLLVATFVVEKGKPLTTAAQ